MAVDSYVQRLLGTKDKKKEEEEKESNSFDFYRSKIGNLEFIESGSVSIEQVGNDQKNKLLSITSGISGVSENALRSVEEFSPKRSLFSPQFDPRGTRRFLEKGIRDVVPNTFNFIKGVFQEISKTPVALGLYAERKINEFFKIEDPKTLGELVTGREDERKEDVFQPKGLTAIAFGEEEVVDIEDYGKEFLRGFDVGNANVEKFGLVMGLALGTLDVTGWGTEKKLLTRALSELGDDAVIKLITKIKRTKDPIKIRKQILDTLKSEKVISRYPQVGKEDLKALTEGLAEISDEKVLKQIFNNIKEDPRFILGKTGPLREATFAKVERDLIRWQRENGIIAPSKDIAKLFGIAKSRGVSRKQLNLLKKTFISSRRISRATKEEITEFIAALKKISTSPGQPFRISRKKSLTILGDVNRRFGRVTFFDRLLRSPEKVFGLRGFGTQGDEIFKSINEMGLWLGNKTADIANWQKKTLGWTFKTALFKKKEMVAQSRKLFKAANSGSLKGLTVAERKVVNEFRSLTDEVADRIDEVRRQIGLEPINRKENYITNVITENARLLIKESKTPPNELFAILEKKLPANVVDNLLKERKGLLPIKEDFWRAAEVMVKTHGKYIFLQRPVHQFYEFMKLWGDAMPGVTREYVTKRVQRFLGKPDMVTKFLRQMDDGLNEIIQKVLPKQFGRKKIVLKLQRNMEEVFDVPRFTVKFFELALPTLKSIKYMADLSFSIPFFILNTTQFFVNTPAKLRGGFITRYKDASVGYYNMLTDLFNPKSWEKMRRAGILGEVDTIMANEYGAGTKIAEFMNLFGKVSEFMNRTASFNAANRNLATLAKQGKLRKLIPELEAKFGGEFDRYAKSISDVTQFVYGVESRPSAFDNAIGRMFEQYNTFVIKQIQFIEDMARNLKFTKLLPDAKRAIREGTFVDFLATLNQSQRGEILRFAMNTAMVYPVLSMVGLSPFEVIAKSVVPSFIEGSVKVFDGINDWWDGNIKAGSQKVGRGVLQMIIPPALKPLVDLKPELLIPGRKVPEQYELARAIILGEDFIKKDDLGRVQEIITPDEARGKLLFGFRAEEAVEKQEEWEQVLNLRGEGEITRIRKQRLAREILDDMRDADNPQDKQEVFRQAIASGELDDDVAGKIIELIETEKFGIGSFERTVKALPVKQRADYVLTQLQLAENQKEKAQVIEQMINQGILTDAVAKELINIFEHAEL